MDKYLPIFPLQEKNYDGTLYHYIKYSDLFLVVQAGKVVLRTHDIRPVRDQGLPSTGRRWLSFTRDYLYRLSGRHIRLSFDGRKLGFKYKLEPFDYSGDSTAGDEKEERIITDKPALDLTKEVLQIDFWVPTAFQPHVEKLNKLIRGPRQKIRELDLREIGVDPDFPDLMGYNPFSLIEGLNKIQDQGIPCQFVTKWRPVK